MNLEEFDKFVEYTKCKRSEYNKPYLDWYDKDSWYISLAGIYELVREDLKEYLQGSNLAGDASLRSKRCGA